MACRYKVKIDGKLVGFEEFQDSSLEYLRSQIEDEIGELLPTEFKFVMKGIPVSGKQEMAYTVRDVAEWSSAGLPCLVQKPTESTPTPTTLNLLHTSNTLAP